MKRAIIAAALIGGARLDVGTRDRVRGRPPGAGTPPRR